MTPYRYLLVDLDGTLLNRQGALTPRTHAALHRVVNAGLTLVLATGRTYASLQRLTAGLDLPPFYMITTGGTVGLSPGAESVCYTHFLAPELWPVLAAGLEAEGLSTLVFTHRHPDPPLFHVSHTGGDPHFEAYVSRNRHLCREHADLPGAALDSVVEVAALGRRNGFDAASARVLERFGSSTRCHSMMLRIEGHHGKITEFFAPGVSKWRAFQGMFPEAARHPEIVLAIGDEANDVEMVREAGLGIAMGNAVPSVRAVADRITGDLDHDGVAEALERLLD